jgi:hypothetical protein
MMKMMMRLIPTLPVDATRPPRSEAIAETEPAILTSNYLVPDYSKLGSENIQNQEYLEL